MYNDLFTIGSVTIHTYGLMTAIGIIAAYLTLEAGFKKNKLPGNRVIGVLLSCLIGGYLCSKLLYIITILPELIANPASFRSAISGGWVVFGGILGGILGGFIFCKWKKLEAWKVFDIGLASVALAQGFGRFGCFMAGCCYGAETTGPFYVVFTHSDFAPNGVHLIPTQLIMCVLDFLLFFFLVWYKKKQKHDGECTAFYLILYSAGRFILEFFRGDAERGAVGRLSTSQFIGLFTLVVGIIILIKRRRVQAAEVITEEEIAETPAEEAEAENSEKTI